MELRTQRQNLAELKSRHHHPTYSKMAFTLGCGVQGEGHGCEVFDENGAPFLAMFDQYGNQSFGYSHERLVGALQEQLRTANVNSTKIMFEEVQIRLTQRLSELTEGALPYAYLASSGGESIDNALKLARATTGRPGFVTAVDCFHGKTMATLSASGRPEHEAIYRPLMPGFRQVPFGDVAALEAAVDGSTAAVLLEPVQAEGGVVVPPDDYLRQARRICSERGALLILDEMQTAFGRCGTFFAFQRFGVVPDLVCIGKAFGGGLLSLSAVLGAKAVWGPLERAPSTFGSSLGGNPLSCSVGLAAVELASEPGFLARVDHLAGIMLRRLSPLPGRFPALLRAHRGLGMMHGLEFHDQALGGLVLRLLLERQVTSAYAVHNNSVLRIQPPMVIEEHDLVRGLDVVESVLETVQQYRAGGGPVGRAAMSPLTLRLGLPCAAEQVRMLLTRSPRVFDPFSLVNEAETGPSVEPEFAGTLGGDRVEWSDRVERTDDGVVLRADPGWMWRTLTRRFDVVPIDDTSCRLDVHVAWDAGTGGYEALLAGGIGYFVTTRLRELTARTARLLTAPTHQHQQNGLAGRVQPAGEATPAVRPPVVGETMHPSDMRLNRLLDRFAENASAVLVDIGVGGARRRISFATLAGLVRARAGELTAAGIRPGQLIGVRAGNSIEWIVWDLAALEVGALVHALPDSAPPAAPEHVMAEAGLALLVTDQPGEYPADGPVLRPADSLTGHRLRPGAPARPSDDLYSQVFSSGTSGSLKGLRVSRAGSEYVATRFLEAFSISEEDRHLIFLPLWSYQQRLSVYSCLWAGADIVLAPFQRVFSALRSEQPTFVIAPPVFYDSALQLHRKASDRTSLRRFLGGRIRFMITGMAPIRRSTLDAFQEADVRLLEAYGTNESGIIAWNTPTAHRIGTVGRPVDVGAVDFTEDGEIVIRRDAPLSLGYFETDGPAGETFLADGSIATGDFGSLDADGFLSLRGRRKDVITLGSGRKVNPTEIEALFTGIDGVAELVVVSTGGSGRLGAVVTLATPGDPLAEALARREVEKVNASVEHDNRLSRLVFVDHPVHSDPRFQTGNMKLRRTAVADYFAELVARDATPQAGANGSGTAQAAGTQTAGRAGTER